MNKPFSIIGYSLAGFFIYTVMLLSFLNKPPAAAKFVMMGVFAVLAAVCLLIGLRASPYAHWRRDVGIVFLSASLFTLFLVLSVACMLATPEFTQMFPENKMDFFSDYVTGASCIVASLGLGCWLMWAGRGRDTKLA